jgi:hypothetical protein
LNISINGEQIDFSIENDETIGEILGSVESECESSGMTVTGIAIDGREIPADELDAFFAMSPKNVASIELTTISGNDVKSMLAGLGNKFVRRIDELVEIPILLQTGKDLRVMEIINEFSGDLHSLYRIIPLLGLAGFTDGKPDIDGTPLGDYPSVLAPFLRDLLEALEKKDTILVGDLSEYEIAPRIERLGAILSSIS